jgi:pyroglutamyl-peptidase
VEGAPPEYACTLPLDAMEAALIGASVPVERSGTAGRFVCNDMFYRLMHWSATAALDVPCGFVHVPHLEGHGGKHGWELSRLEEAARVMVAAAVRAI